MSDILETVVVKGQGGEPLIINKSDFTNEQYELFDSLPVAPQEAVAPVAKVVKRNGKFLIVNTEGKPLTEQFFDTKEEAEVTLKIITGSM